MKVVYNKTSEIHTFRCSSGKLIVTGPGHYTSHPEAAAALEAYNIMRRSQRGMWKRAIPVADELTVADKSEAERYAETVREFHKWRTYPPMSCSHDWRETMGFMTVYKDCALCGAKWEDQE